MSDEKKLLEAQQAVLGSMLIDEKTVGLVLQDVTPDDFTTGAYRQIFLAFRAQFASGAACDPVTVNARLGGKYDRLLMELIEITPTSANIKSYVAILKQEARIHRLQDVAQRMLEAEDEDALRALMSEANALSVERPGLRVVGMEDALSKFYVRHGDEIFELDVLRASIQTQVASCRMLDGNVGYIKINNFDARCFDETSACIDEMLAQGAKALLFDVRFNGGGYKDEMVKILDKLLPEGVLFQSEDYAGRKETDTSDEACIELPMAVLVNLDSYSAAEFFAAALQEYGWAEVVGEKTCGKGNFQTGFQLSDGSLLNISIGKYYTPQGRSLTDLGVTPDVEIEYDDETYAKLYYSQLEDADDTQLQAALRILTDKIS